MKIMKRLPAGEGYFPALREGTAWSRGAVSGTALRLPRNSCILGDVGIDDAPACGVSFKSVPQFWLAVEPVWSGFGVCTVFINRPESGSCTWCLSRQDCSKFSLIPLAQRSSGLPELPGSIAQQMVGGQQWCSLYRSCKQGKNTW